MRRKLVVNAVAVNQRVKECTRPYMSSLASYVFLGCDKTEYFTLVYVTPGFFLLRLSRVRLK